MDVAALAFVEAAAHLGRLRGALADAAVTIDDGRLVDLLVTEADALARGGDTVDARGLLRHASEVADRAAGPERIAAVAMATACLGLLACLLARHDVVWTPGTGAERAAIARELISVALAVGDEERHAEGLLLLANFVPCWSFQVRLPAVETGAVRRATPAGGAGADHGRAKPPPNCSRWRSSFEAATLTRSGRFGFTSTVAS